MANDIIITPVSASIQFSGSAYASIKLTVDTSGSLLVTGNSGSLFSITDNFSGSLMSVNTISGLPIMEIFSDNRVNIGKYASEAIKVQSGGSDVALGSGSVMFITSSGRVGIGVNSPVNKLDVSGNISCSAITASFFGTSSWATNALTASSLVVGNSYNITNLTASNIITSATGSFGTITSSGNIQVGPYNVSSITPSQLVFGDYQTSGTTRPQFIFSGVASWMGLGQLTASSVNQLRLGTVSLPNTNWGTFGATTFNLMIDGGLSIGTTSSLNNGLLISGKVGFGASNPVNALDIRNVLPVIHFDRNGSYSWRLGTNDGSTYSGATSNFGLWDNSGVSRLHILASNGNVGIGTTSAVATLAVVPSGSTFDSTNAMVAYFGKNTTNGYGSTFIRVSRYSNTTTTGSSEYTDIEHNSIGSGPFRYGTYADTNIINGVSSTSGLYGSINFVTSGSTRMTIAGGTSAGNVGIGTSSPGTPLHVVGTTGNIIRYDRPSYGSFNSTISTAMSGSNADLFMDANQASSGFVWRVRNSSNGIIFALGLDRNGNMGIGTTNPGYLLDVSGSSRFGFTSTNTHQFTGSVSISGSGTLTIPWTGNNALPSLIIGNDPAHGLTRVNGNANIAVISNGAIAAQFTSNGVTAAGFGIQNYTNAQVGGLGMTVGSVAWGPSTIMDVNLSRINTGSVAVGTGTNQSTGGTLIAGKIGIGSTSPGYLLDVSGSSRFGFGSTNTHQFTGSVSISGSLNATSSWATNSLTASSLVSANSYNITNLTASNQIIYKNSVLLDYSSSTLATSQSNYVVLQNLTGSYNSAFFDYFASSASNFRAGTMIVGWSGSDITYTEYATTDIGNTNQLTMSVGISASYIQLLSNAYSSLNWNVKSSGKYL